MASRAAWPAQRHHDAAMAWSHCGTPLCRHCIWLQAEHLREKAAHSSSGCGNHPAMRRVMHTCIAQPYVRSFQPNPMSTEPTQMSAERPQQFPKHSNILSRTPSQALAEAARTRANHPTLDRTQPRFGRCHPKVGRTESRTSAAPGGSSAETPQIGPSHPTRRRSKDPGYCSPAESMLQASPDAMPAAGRQRKTSINSCWASRRRRRRETRLSIYTDQSASPA